MLEINKCYSYDIIEKECEGLTEEDEGQFIINEHTLIYKDKLGNSKYRFLLDGYINQGIYKLVAKF